MALKKKQGAYGRQQEKPDLNWGTEVRKGFQISISNNLKVYLRVGLVAVLGRSMHVKH